MDKTFKEAAEYYQSLAHRSEQAGNSLGARMAYYMSVQAWEKTIESHPSFINYLIAAQKEYTHFMKTDRTYHFLLEEIKHVIERHPGILQTDLYKELPKYHHTDLNHVLYFAAKEGEIKKTKCEDDAQLSLPVKEKKRGIKTLFAKLGVHSTVHS